MARMEYAHEAKETVLRYASQLQTYGGAYFRDDGDRGLVILTTENDPVETETIRTLSPASGPVSDVRHVAHTYRALKDAMTSAWTSWEKLALDVDLLAVAVDVKNNRLRLDVSRDDLAEALKAAPALESLLGVPVAVAEGEPSTDAVCSDRDHCYNPFRAGIVIRKGSSTSSARCTMGFQVVHNGDRQFVTAGHCGFSGANSWYHMGYGYIGDETATRYYGGGKDIMRVAMPDSQRSVKLYGVGDVLGLDRPVTGDDICTSLGVSAGTTCGTVSDDSVGWVSNTCSCTVFGADATYSTIPGDSGSPVYQEFSMQGGGVAFAMGVNDTADGKFAILADALTLWGDSLYQGG